MNSIKQYTEKEKELILSAFGSVYDAVYFLELSKDSYYEISAIDYIHAWIAEKGSIREDFLQSVSKLEYEKNEQTLCAFFENKLFRCKFEQGDKTSFEFETCKQHWGKVTILFQSADACMILFEKTPRVLQDNVAGNQKKYGFTNFRENLRKLDSVDGSIIAMSINSYHTISSIIGVYQTNELNKMIWNLVCNHLLDGDYAAHINADNYVFFYPEIRRDEIRRRLQALSKEIKGLTTQFDSLMIQPSFGVVAWNGKSDVEYAYNSARSAKKYTRNMDDSQIFFFDYEAIEHVMDNKRLEDSFQSALDHQEFEIWYQPRFDVQTGEIVEAEALLRWRRSDGKLIYPDVFIPLFEKNGMIRLLDQYVFKTVCETQKQWKQTYGSVIPVSVNLSRASLYYSDLVQQYSSIIDEVGIERRLVPIEITETASLDIRYIKDIDEAFSKQNFVLQIDDFGVGYSSLADLLSMHFATIKLDKTLIDRVGNDIGERLLKHVVSMSKDLGMTVTAEGVEKKEQIDFLKEIGCDCIQGYYFSPPIEKAVFEKLVYHK